MFNSSYGECTMSSSRFSNDGIKKEKNKKNVFIHFTKRDKNYIRYKVLDGQCCQVAFDISVS